MAKFLVDTAKAVHVIQPYRMGLCDICGKQKAVLKRSKTLQRLCKECFFHVFETEVHNVIVDNTLFQRGDKVAIGASGGKGRQSLFVPTGHLVLIG